MNENLLLCSLLFLFWSPPTHKTGSVNSIELFFHRLVVMLDRGKVNHRKENQPVKTRTLNFTNKNNLLL